jgi:hypothetical protein
VWDEFCVAMNHRTASDAQRQIVYKLYCTALMSPGMLDTHLRASRTASVPPACRLCMECMVTEVHSRIRNRILYDPLHGFGSPRDDPVLTGLVLYAAFDSWCKHTVRLHWIQRFVLMLADWEQAQYVLRIRSREPVIVQRVGGFDVWYSGEVVDCGGDSRLALFNWYKIIDADFDSRVLGTYVLPRIEDLHI